MAIDDQTIICLAGCNNTATVNISTTLPFPTTELCDINVPFQNAVEGEFTK